MKHSITIIITLLLSITVTYATNLEDKAFNAYKDKQYSESIKLYRQAARENSLKAILMLGLFSEQGIGTYKSTKRAIKLYKYILKKTNNIKKIINSKDKIKKLDLTIAALKRLYILTGNNQYKYLSIKIEKLKNGELKYKKNNPPKVLYNQNKNTIDDFLILCPHAQKVSPEDREGIEEFDCSLFENFPNRMALFMKLRRLKFKAMKNPNKTAQILNILNIKLDKVVQPMIKFLEQDSINCYNNAQTNTDIESCDYDYLSKSDPLLFDNASYKMEKALSNNNIKTYILGNFEKKALINKLIEQIKENQYGKPWRVMLK